MLKNEINEGARLMLSRKSGLLVCALIALFAVMAGCSGKTEKKKETAPEKRARVQVDCEKMCIKTFKQCVGEVLVASKKMDQAKIDMIKKAGAWHKIQNAGYGACVKNCKQKGGFGADAAKINKCLKMKECNAYASCIKEHLK